MAQPFDQLREIRLQKLQDLQQIGINPYPAQVNRQQMISQALAMMEQEVIIAGRIRSIRGHGNLQFLDVQDQSGKMQVMIRKDLVSPEVFALSKKLDIGDFISVTGKVFTTQSGEITVEAHELQILAKALRPLPDTWYVLKDVEERYRKRYLDMILNPEVKQKILVRTQVIQKLREFLLKEGFVEVETPILEVNASGALAKPFTTHINAYDMDLYLRICMGELWQKKLIIAGFEKTFEIGRAFRNEGVDREHNPEFTMLEYYWGYADYQINMGMQEQLIGYVVKEVTGDYKIKIGDQEVDFTPPYPRRRFRDLIVEHTGVDIDAYEQLADLQKAIAEHGLKVDPAWGRGHLVDEFYKAYVRPKLIKPVFLTHHPKDLKPLAKEDPDYPGYTQSFQLLANGFEISNNYSELNDPIDQAQRFAKQSQLEAQGDNETMSADDEFVEALEYGMPPTSGTGIGIDRFAALLTNSHHVREVIAFPLMKPAGQQEPRAYKLELQDNKTEAESIVTDENSKRFVVVLNKKIEIGTLMNAVGHLTAGFVGSYPDLKDFEFLDYVDAGKKSHAILSHFPFIILKAENSSQIQNLRQGLEAKQIPFADFTQSMSIGTSAEQLEATKQKREDELEYFGVIMFGKTEELKNLTKKFSLFK